MAKPLTGALFSCHTSCATVTLRHKALLSSLTQIKGLPNKVSSKIDLIDLLKRLIWQMSAQHSAINYPMTDYGAYTLNTPTKLYSDDRLPSDRFTLYNLPNANITAVGIRNSKNGVRLPADITAISELHFASVSKRVLVRSLSYGN